MRQQMEQIRIAHREQMRLLSKMFVWCEMDAYYGGRVAHCETAKVMLDDYLSGKLDRLEQLEEPRFGKPLVSYGGAGKSALPYSK